eukprot:c15658_g2_i1.p1 GENE.c15658_g2_i1~~c15658_g2_i1.p1  ORF type:complete len:650 (+),score=0.04 c15658_g2_i1:112-2061(+)
MAEKVIWFAPADINGNNVGVADKVILQSLNADISDVKNAIQEKFEKKWSAIINNWAFCFLAMKDAQDNQKAILKPKIITIGEDQEAPPGNYHKLAPEAIVTGNTSITPLLLVHPVVANNNNNNSDMGNESKKQKLSHPWQTFMEALMKADYKDNFLTLSCTDFPVESFGIQFAEDISGNLTLKPIFNRPCYQQLTKAIMSGNYKDKIWVRGTPGIGKSMYSILLVREYLLKGINVLYWSACKGNPTDIVKVFFNISNIENLVTSYVRDLQELKNAKFVHIYDTCAPPNSTFVNQKQILISSNEFSNCKDFSKMSPECLFLPPADLDEILQAKFTIGKDDVTIKRLYSVFGGSFRQLIYNSDDDVCKFLADVKNFTMESFKLHYRQLTFAENSTGSDTNTLKIYDRYLHVVPIQPYDAYPNNSKHKYFQYGNFQRRFCSFNVNVLFGRQYADSYLEEMQFNYMVASEIGKRELLEQLAHTLFTIPTISTQIYAQFNENITTKKLSDNSSFIFKRPGSKDLQCSSVWSTEDITPKIFDNTGAYYVTFSKKTNESIDSLFISPDMWVCFNMTTGATHSIAAQGIQYVRNARQSLQYTTQPKLYFLFVTPDESQMKGEQNITNNKNLDVSTFETIKNELKNKQFILKLPTNKK